MYGLIEKPQSLATRNSIHYCHTCTLARASAHTHTRIRYGTRNVRYCESGAADRDARRSGPGAHAVDIGRCASEGSGSLLLRFRVDRLGDVQAKLLLNHLRDPMGNLTRNRMTLLSLAMSIIKSIRINSKTRHLDQCRTAPRSQGVSTHVSVTWHCISGQRILQMKEGRFLPDEGRHLFQRTSISRSRSSSNRFSGSERSRKLASSSSMALDSEQAHESSSE